MTRPRADHALDMAAALGRLSHQSLALQAAAGELDDDGLCVAVEALARAVDTLALWIYDNRAALLPSPALRAAALADVARARAGEGLSVEHIQRLRATVEGSALSPDYYRRTMRGGRRGAAPLTGLNAPG